MAAPETTAQAIASRQLVSGSSGMVGGSFPVTSFQPEDSPFCAAAAARTADPVPMILQAREPTPSSSVSSCRSTTSTGSTGCRVVIRPGHPGPRSGSEQTDDPPDDRQQHRRRDPDQPEDQRERDDAHDG